MNNSKPKTYLTKPQLDEVIELLSHVDPEYIPIKKSSAFTVLALLILDRRIEKDIMLSILGDDPRSPLQQLRGKRFGYWNISNIGHKKGVYVIDPRHLTGNDDDDRKARFEALLSFTDKSYRQCLRESERVGPAFQQFCAARSNQIPLDL